MIFLINCVWFDVDLSIGSSNRFMAELNRIVIFLLFVKFSSNEDFSQALNSFSRFIKVKCIFSEMYCVLKIPNTVARRNIN